MVSVLCVCTFDDPTGHDRRTWQRVFTQLGRLIGHLAGRLAKALS